MCRFRISVLGEVIIDEKRLWEQLGHRTLDPHQIEGENSSGSRMRCKCFLPFFIVELQSLLTGVELEYKNVFHFKQEKAQITILHSRASIPSYSVRIRIQK